MGQIHLSDKPCPSWSWRPKISGFRMNYVRLSIWVEYLQEEIKDVKSFYKS